MTWANRVTLLRFLLVPFFVGALVYYEPGKDYLRLVALFIFLLATATDALDGYIARSRSQKTALGVILDPLADKLLLMSAYIVLAMMKTLPESFRVPPWVSILVLSRDLFILSGSAIIYLVTQDLRVQPSVLGKITTFFQMATILVVLCGFPLRLPFFGVTACVTLLSGLGYFRYGVGLLNGSSPSS